MLISRTDIIIGERMRTHSSERKQKITELRHSIVLTGLMNPPTVEALPDGKYLLTAGETRLAAIDELAKDTIIFMCGNESVLPGFVPVTIFDERTELNRLEAEHDENYVRSDPSWEDRNRHLAKMHRMRLAANPKQTVIDTAKELNARGTAKQGSGNASGAPADASAKVETLRKQIANALILEPHLNDPTITKARNSKEAVALVLDKEAKATEAELIRRRRVGNTDTAQSNIKCGDLFTLFADESAGRFDFIFGDPPYGINAHQFHKGDRSNASNSNSHGGASATNLHNYDDTPEYARKILKCILTEGWRVTKSKANLCLFTDIAHFDYLQQQSSAMGWVPWRRPIIWRKSKSEGLISGWGRHGCIMTYDVIFLATKGQRGLIKPMLDVLEFDRVARNKRLYAAEKPVPLLSHIIDHATYPGDIILDPCAGSGSTLVAARDTKRHAIGYEMDVNACNIAEVRLNTMNEDEFDKTDIDITEDDIDENNPL
jgi:site-specific DNA-methyltransferase (adenine-specific)